MSDPERAGDLVASVIVPTHQGAHRLPTLLGALARQTPPFRWEVVVVIDGSTDHTAEVIASYRNRLPVRVLTNPTAAGTAAALTGGYRAANGTYLIRCDDDLSPSDSFIADHVAAHDGRDDRAVIGLTPDLFPDTGYARVYGRQASRRACRAAYARPPAERWIHWAANNSLHRNAWAGAGGFDARFVYGEDFELGYRLSRAGLTLLIDPRLEAGHRGPATTAATRVPRAFVSGASHRLFDQVHPGARPAASPSRDLRGRVWTTAVRIVSALARSHAAARRLGRVTDQVIRVAPAPLAGRLVAIAVEAAGRSGRLHGATDLAGYRGQKRAELAAEHDRPPDPPGHGRKAQ
ncbi:MAG: glycosyltransferase family 2 protein [Propioniciclava sp.]